QEREPGWEFGAHLLYMNSADVGFRGGSSVSTEDEVGVSIAVAYRFNSRFEVQLDLDSYSVDYDVSIVSDTREPFRGRGTLDTVSPRFSATFNFLEGPLTPYVTAGIGWSFIDTNIPEGPAYLDCFWDPWWGRICERRQDTRTIDDLTYKAGLGLRWDFSPRFTLRVGYEKKWIDFDEATSTPDFDQFKAGVMFRL
ncbi:MAG TPA: outer membrane beta-barrel protein, partial [Steroidobacteraceae bacterium]